MYMLYYASMLQCWHLVWILVRSDYPCLGVGCHISHGWCCPCMRTRWPQPSLTLWSTVLLATTVPHVVLAWPLARWSLHRGSGARIVGGHARYTSEHQDGGDSPRPKRLALLHRRCPNTPRPTSIRGDQRMAWNIPAAALLAWRHGLALVRL
jgi:hypothetical protein